jgi:hypothetical protein
MTLAGVQNVTGTHIYTERGGFAIASIRFSLQLFTFVERSFPPYSLPYRCCTRLSCYSYMTTSEGHQDDSLTTGSVSIAAQSSGGTPSLTEERPASDESASPDENVEENAPSASSNKRVSCPGHGQSPLILNLPTALF